MMHEDFETMMSRYVPADVLNSISDKLDTLKRKVNRLLASGTRLAYIENIWGKAPKCGECRRRENQVEWGMGRGAPFPTV